MKTTSYNSSRKTYLCPAIKLSDLAAEELICLNSKLNPGGQQETVNTETKRRHGIFNDAGNDTEKEEIWW